MPTTFTSLCVRLAAFTLFAAPVIVLTDPVDASPVSSTPGQVAAEPVTATTTGAARNRRTGDLSRTPRKVVAGEPFPVKGRLPAWASGHRKRVWLQRRERDRWLSTRTGTAARNGAFTFRRVTVGAGDNRLRVAVSRNGRRVPATRTIPVTAVHPTVTARTLPSLAQPGRTPADIPSGRLVTAQVDPPVRGDETTLERRTGSGWRAVDRQRQDATGQVVYRVTGRGVYRVVSGVSTSRPVTVTPSKLLFADDFAGPLDTTVWNHQERPRNEATGRSCAETSPFAVASTGRTLRLGVRLDPASKGTPCAYPDGVSSYLLNSQVATEESFSFTYGYVAARMRLHRSQGMHSAFWLLPADLECGRNQWYVHGAAEVDVVEFFGDPAGDIPGLGIASFVHGPTSSGTYTKVGDPVANGYSRVTAHLKPAGHEWWDSYHVFSVEWTPTELTFRVDGRVYFVESTVVPRVPLYPVLSMLTADYELSKLSLSSLDDSADVDWVTVHALED